MKFNKQIIFVLFVGVLLMSGTTVVSAELTTDKDKLSYTVGADIARSLATIKEEVNLDKVLLGVTDQFNEKDLLLADEEMLSIMQDFSQKMQQKLMEEMQTAGAQNALEGESFLKENKEKEGVITTASGLQYLVEKEGDGPKPTATDTVKVHYRGTKIDGTEFDSSYSRGEPATFPVTGVIPGWTEALQLMTVGSKYKLSIPAELAYGQRGPGAIGPNAVLLFDVELIGIE